METTITADGRVAVETVNLFSQNIAYWRQPDSPIGCREVRGITWVKPGDPLSFNIRRAFGADYDVKGKAFTGSVRIPSLFGGTEVKNVYTFLPDGEKDAKVWLFT